MSGACNGTTFVIVNDAHIPARQESDLHHEAAHLLRQDRPSRIIKVGELSLREYDTEAEAEAGWLAGCLHLPRAALLRALRQGEDDLSIARRYVASAEMIRFRRSVTGIDRQLAIRSRSR